MLLPKAFRVFMGFALAFALFGSVLLPVQATASDPSLMVMLENAQEKSTQSKDVHVLSARVLINVPTSFVWAALTNLDNLKNMIPGYRSSQVVSSKGGSKVIDFVQNVAMFLPTYHYRVQVEESRPDYHITMRRISGDFKTMLASYQLIPKNNGTQTLLVHRLQIDPGTTLPGTNQVLVSHAKKTMQSIKSFTEAGYKTQVLTQR